MARNGLGGRDRPVAARDDARPRLLEGADLVQPRRARGADQRLDVLRDRGIREHPEGLKIGEHVERGQARDVCGIDELEMRDMVAEVGWAVRRAHGGKRVEPFADRTVADAVHVDLEAGGRRGAARSP